MERKPSFGKKIVKIAVGCLTVFVLLSGCRMINRHFEELRFQKRWEEPKADFIPSIGFSLGYRLGIPEEYRDAFENCHRFLEWKQDAAATYIVNDQKREYLVVTELMDNLYDSVTMCEEPKGEPAERWSDWLEVLPALECDGEYWSFCYPVTRVSYLYEEATYELTGDYGQVIVNKVNNKVVGYIFPAYLKEK